MKLITIASLLLVLLPAKNVVRISGEEYRQATIAERFRTDKKVLKKEHKLSYSNNCRPLADNQDPDDLYEHTYLGYINLGADHSVIKREYDNEEEYLLINNKTCRVTRLRGRPYKFKKWICCTDGSMDTDKHPVIEVWKIDSAGLHKIRTIPVAYELDPQEFRMTASGQVVFKDHYDKFWRLTDVF